MPILQAQLLDAGRRHDSALHDGGAQGTTEDRYRAYPLLLDRNGTPGADRWPGASDDERTFGRNAVYSGGHDPCVTSSLAATSGGQACRMTHCRRRGL